MEKEIEQLKNIIVELVAGQKKIDDKIEVIGVVLENIQEAEERLEASVHQIEIRFELWIELVIR